MGSAVINVAVGKPVSVDARVNIDRGDEEILVSLRTFSMPIVSGFLRSLPISTAHIIPPSCAVVCVCACILFISLPVYHTRAKQLMKLGGGLNTSSKPSTNFLLE